MFKMRFSEDLKKKKSPFVVPELVEAMKIFKLSEKDFLSNLDRKKCIFIEDSFIKYYGTFSKRSFILNPRNPLKKDETVIDYDMSSEEEWNEQNGEDLEGKQEEEEEDDEEKQFIEEMHDEKENEGFIVPDDYLSASELNFT